MSKPATPKAVRKPITCLPISDAIIRDPQQFANWIYAHTPLILQELFNALPSAPPAEQLKTLSSLYQTGLSYRPLVTIKPSDASSDVASELRKMLMQETDEVVEQEETAEEAA